MHLRTQEEAGPDSQIVAALRPQRLDETHRPLNGRQGGKAHGNQASSRKDNSSGI